MTIRWCRYIQTVIEIKTGNLCQKLSFKVNMLYSTGRDHGPQSGTCVQISFPIQFMRYQ